jgi:hypothetical protein
LFVLEQIHAMAVRAQHKLALGVNGRALGYGDFWRLIEACRASLAPRLPDHGVALLIVGSTLESWILSLALRSLGLDVAVLPSPGQVALFEGLDIACVITLTTEAADAVATPAEALSLNLTWRR